MAKLGYKLNTTDGRYQVSLFPVQQINITQGPGGTYSHYGTLNTDNSVNQWGLAALAAPFDCVIVYAEGGGYGITIYQSLKPVMTPSGVRNVTFSLMHDNKAYRWKKGMKFKQGDHIYNEGDADPSDLTTGIHSHIEVAFGHTTRRIKSIPGGRYHLQGQVRADQAFYKNGAEMISEVPEPWTNSKSLKFKHYAGGQIEKPKEKLKWISKNDYLSDDEQLNNAKIIYTYFSEKGWSHNAISAVLGNMSQESNVNPGFWEGRDRYPNEVYRGFGLVQWTPWRDIINWQKSIGVSDGDGNGQLRKMWDEYKADTETTPGHTRREWYKTRKYPYSYGEFAKSKDSIERLTDMYVRNYLRPNMDYANMSNRIKRAKWFAKELKDYNPNETVIEPTRPDQVLSGDGDGEGIISLLFGNWYNRR